MLYSRVDALHDDDAYFRGKLVTPDRPSRSERIANDLLQRIARRELQVGTKLPSENALAGQFGVSRAVVREAIARLKAEGVVQSLRGSGAFVRDPADLPESALEAPLQASLESLLDLIEVRRVIESEMAARAATVRTHVQMAMIESAFDRLVSATGNGVREDCAFHASIAVATGNVYWRRMNDALAAHISTAIRVTRINEAQRETFTRDVLAEHTALRDAIAAGDPEAARRAAIHHLEQAAARILSAEPGFWRNDGAPIVNLPRSRD